jgi:hypothetical protein
MIKLLATLIIAGMATAVLHHDPATVALIAAHIKECTP